MGEMLVLELNGFVMNAGILGFIRLLEHQKAKKGEDYVFEDNRLLISKSYLLSQDLAQAYIETANELFYSTTHYAKMVDAIESLHQFDELLKTEEKEWDKESTDRVKEQMKRVMMSVSNLTALTSMKNACKWLHQQFSVDLLTLFEQAKREKSLKERIKRLRDLNQALKKKEVKERLVLVGVSLKVLSNFWANKAFIRESQGNIIVKSDQDMRELLDVNVVQCFKQQLTTKSTSPKRCLECDAPLPRDSQSQASNLSFLNDMLDDMSKKSSAFWEFNKNQALMCDVCAFVYLMMPFGFTWMGKEMVFVNANTNLDVLKSMNTTSELLLNMEGNKRWSAFYQGLAQQCLASHVHQQENLQVIFRPTQREKHYRFSVLNYEILDLLKESQGVLTSLSKFYPLKLDKKRELDVYNEVVSNVLNQRNQYDLMVLLLRLSSRSDLESVATTLASLIFSIQKNKQTILLTKVNQDGVKEGFRMTDKQFYVAIRSANEDGLALNRHLIHVNKKGIESVMYPLLNAIQTNNKHNFLAMIVRLATSYGLSMRTDYCQLLLDDATFKDVALAYVLGLKGRSNYSTKKEMNEEEIKHD